MIIEGHFTVPAPQEQVWTFLQDLRRVSACVPGAEDVEEIAPDTYRGRLKVQVGAIRANFEGEVAIVQRQAPSRLVAQVKGRDPRLASTVDATFEGILEPVDGQTRLTYKVDLTLRGRIAQFGRAVIQGTARKMTQAFAECLADTLRGENNR